MLLLHRNIVLPYKTIFCCKHEAKEHSSTMLAVSNILHFCKGCSMSTIHNNTAIYCMCRNIGFPKKRYRSFERKLSHGAMHIALLQRAWRNCPRNTSYFLWILSLQKHTALPQRKVLLFRMVSCISVLNNYCVCWQVWGCCNYVQGI